MVRRTLSDDFGFDGSKPSFGDGKVAAKGHLSHDRLNWARPLSHQSC
jgi:hypothetical protein